MDGLPDLMPPKLSVKQGLYSLLLQSLLLICISLELLCLLLNLVLRQFDHEFRLSPSHFKGFDTLLLFKLVLLSVNGEICVSVLADFPEAFLCLLVLLFQVAYILSLLLLALHNGVLDSVVLLVSFLLHLFMLLSFLLLNALLFEFRFIGSFFKLKLHLLVVESSLLHYLLTTLLGLLAFLMEILFLLLLHF